MKEELKKYDGCNVRGNWEHRCHGTNCDCERPVCQVHQGKTTYDELSNLANKENEST